MAKFTTRVELHELRGGKKPTGEDYEKLHKEMEEKNFSRIITDTKGKRYQLPPAEYNRDATITKETVLEDAKVAAKKIWSDYSILVTESNGRTWHNLTEL
jgi:hypothetical protein